MENFSPDTTIILLASILVVLILMLVNNYSRRKSFEEEAVVQAIKSSYDLFHKLSLQVQKHWGLSHLSIVSYENYKESRTLINTIILEKLKKDKTEEKELLGSCKHRERNMIINLLIFYEQIFYLSKHTDSRLMRKRFFRLLNRYFTERLLLNPRIVYFVLNNADDDGEDLHIEKKSFYYLILKYKQYILKGKKLRVDRKGPIHKIPLWKKGNEDCGLIELTTEDDFRDYLDNPKTYWEKRYEEKLNQRKLLEELEKEEANKKKLSEMLENEEASEKKLPEILENEEASEKKLPEMQDQPAPDTEKKPDAK